jgi:hypothetical protein
MWVFNLRQNKEEMQMSMSKRTLLAGTVGIAAVLSSKAFAQAQRKSTVVTQVGEGDAVWLNPKTGQLEKSNTKLAAAKPAGAKEIPHGAVLYKQGGKMYMFEPAANEAASSNFQNQFDDWSNQ